jgi:hypothetical protein
MAPAHPLSAAFRLHATMSALGQQRTCRAEIAMSASDKIRVSVYGTGPAPDAAKFGVGARSLDDIRKACDARRSN